MRKGFWALLLTVLLLSACTGAEPEGSYPVYFRAMEGEEALAAEYRILPEDMEPVEGLLLCLLDGPQGEGLSRAIPSGVSLREVRLEKGLVSVDFSTRYASLSGIDLTLADFSVVRTLSQLPEVEQVVITVDGGDIPYRDHQCFTAADAWFAGEEAEEP